MAASNIASLLEELTNSQDSFASLQDLKTVLVSVHPSALRNVTQNVSFSVIFQFLQTDNVEQLELCCDILDRLLNATEPSLVLHNFTEDLRNGLSHHSTAVKCLCIKQLTRVCEEVSDELIPQENVVEKIVQLFADQSLEVAKEVGKFVSTLARSTGGLCLLYSNTITSTLQQVMRINDTIRFRVYETLISVCMQSLAGLEQTHHSGLIQQLLNEVHKDDILVQLNAIELLSDLTMCDHGLVYLDQQGIVGKLEGMMQNLDSDPMAGLLLPGLMKFFGGVARFHPKEVCSGNQTFVRNVFSTLSSPDPSLRSVAVQTVGFIGTSAEGKMALEKLGNVMDEGLREVGSVIRSSPSELRVKGLQTAASLVKVEVEDQTTELCALTEKWFRQLDRKPFDLMMSVTQQPFDDLRSSAHNVFCSLATQSWGQKMMNESPGFNEYLLDRSTEKTKETKESKFEIIKTLANSPTSQEIFGQPYYVKLKAHYLQGPFFVQVQSEVAFEGD